MFNGARLLEIAVECRPGLQNWLCGQTFRASNRAALCRTLQGWEYVAEEAPSGKGFVSGSVGDRLVLRVPVSGLLFANRVLIALGLRVAPEGMGYAQVRD